MTAKVIAFRRDLYAELTKLKQFPANVTVQELLHRHERSRLIMLEAWNQRTHKLISASYLDGTIICYDHFDVFCLEGGVSKKTVDAFNEERIDWKEARSSPGFLHLNSGKRRN